MKIEGHKKWTATLAGLATSIIGLLVTSGVLTEESASTVTQLVVFLAPLLGAGLYDVLQGAQDLQKEKTKQVIAVNGGLKEKKEEVAPFEIKPFADEPPAFDTDSFDSLQADRAKRIYTVDNPATQFYSAESLGAQTNATHIETAIDFWIYLKDKSYAAFEWLFGFPYDKAQEHLKDNKTCPYYSVENMARQRGIQYWRMLLDVRRVEKILTNIIDLSESGIDWKASLASPTLYSIGSLAGQLLGR